MVSIFSELSVLCAPLVSHFAVFLLSWIVTALTSEEMNPAGYFFVSLVVYVILYLWWNRQHATVTHTIPHAEFRYDRATVHLVDGITGVDMTGWSQHDIASYDIRPEQVDVSQLLPFLRRGDILETVQAGYRSVGIFMWDGQHVIDLDDFLDEYGNPSRDFVVYKEFNPFYWELSSMNFNNMLVPTLETFNFYWHSGNLPSVYVDATTIRNVNADTLQIEFQGETYTIPRELKQFVMEMEVGAEGELEGAHVESDLVDDGMMTGVLSG